MIAVLIIIYRKGHKKMNVEIKRDGLVLRGLVDKSDVKKGPAAIIFHGFNGDLGYTPENIYSMISDSLVAAGISTIRFDFDGHGKSDGNFSDMDVLREIEDAIAILKYARTLDFVTDIYVIGHSQGGVVGGMLSGLYPDAVSRLVLLAAAATLKDDAARGTCMGVQYDTEHIPDIVVLNEGKTKVGGHYFRIAKNLPVYEVTSNYSGKSLIVYGGKDTVVNETAAKRYSEVLRDNRLQKYNELDHCLEGTDQKNLITDIVKFLKS